MNSAKIPMKKRSADITILWRTSCGKRAYFTEGIKQKVLDMIDQGYGLELWAESGDNVLKARKKALIYRRRYQDSEPCLTPCFMGNGGANKISFYRKHKYKIIGNFPVEQKYTDAPVAQELFFSDKLASNAESELLSAMGDKEELKLPGI